MAASLRRGDGAFSTKQMPSCWLSGAADRPTEHESETAQWGLLIVRRGAEPGRIYSLNRQSITVGRTTQNDVLLASNTVSRQHCRIDWADGHYRLEDLRSSNGTRLNGAEVQTAQLHHGDLIELGDQLLEFSTTPEPARHTLPA